MISSNSFTSISDDDFHQAVKLWNESSLEALKGVKERLCPACGSENHSLLYKSYDSHQFDRCKNCGCWFVPYEVTPKLFERFFKLNPQAEALAASIAKKRLDIALETDRERFSMLLDLLRPFHPANLLDIGANAGQFVEFCLERGLIAQGLETDRFALDEAHKKNLPVYPSPQELPEDKYSAITLWETLEHVADPLGLLRFAAQNLRAAGIIALTVPNLNNLYLQQTRGDCPWSHGGYNTPGHINLFGPAQLKQLLDRAGLQPVFFDSFYVSPLVEMSRYLLNGSILPPELEQNCANYLGPYLDFFERHTLTGPILFCIATRKGCSFSAINALEKLRKQVCEAKNQARTRLRFNLASKKVRGRFMLNEATSARCVISANNSRPLDTLGIIKSISLKIGSFSIDLLSYFARGYAEQGVALGCGEGILAIKSGPKKMDYIAKSWAFELPGNTRIKFHAEGTSLEGALAIGLLGTASEAWLFPPLELPRTPGAAPHLLDNLEKLWG